MTLTTILSWCAFSGAVLAAIFAWNVTRLGSVGRLSKRFDTLRQLQDALASDLEALAVSHQTLRSRVGMREVRERRRAEPIDGELPLASDAGSEIDKARIRAELGRKLARGESITPSRP